MQKKKYSYLINKGRLIITVGGNHSKESKQIPNKAKRPLAFSEAQGRDWRFRCISRLCSSEGYEIAFTGHTATDRSETAFLQLIRGTSFHGMVSFGRSKTLKLVYPKYFNYSVFLFT